MSITQITIKATDTAALTTLLMAQGVLVAGEGGVRPALGVLHSHIGSAVLDGVTLAGAFAWIGIDSDAVGSAQAQAMLDSLQPYAYSGPALRVLLGSSPLSSGRPTSASNAKVRAVLIKAGKLAAINAAIAAIDDPTERALAANAFEYETVFYADSQWVKLLAPRVGMTEADVQAIVDAANS